MLESNKVVPVLQYLSLDYDLLFIYLPLLHGDCRTRPHKEKGGKFNPGLLDLRSINGELLQDCMVCVVINERSTTKWMQIIRFDSVITTTMQAGWTSTARKFAATVSVTHLPH